MAELVNLTPHTITIMGESGEVKAEIYPSGQIARVKVEQAIIGKIDDIPVVKTVFSEVEGLPEPRLGTIFIVSSMVAQAVPHREDVVAPDTSPNGAVRDSEGKIVGVKRFQRW